MGFVRRGDDDRWTICVNFGNKTVDELGEALRSIGAQILDAVANAVNKGSDVLSRRLHISGLFGVKLVGQQQHIEGQPNGRDAGSDVVVKFSGKSDTFALYSKARNFKEHRVVLNGKADRNECCA